MRIALGVSYNGQAYSGWQSQPSGSTVQDHLEAALGRFTAQKVSTLCAGRTDAGVHGLMQVVHFDTELQRAPNSWVRGTNTFLPKDIAVQWAAEVPDGPEGFHSRACATARRSAYVLLLSPVRPSVDSGRVGWVFQPLDGERMRAAADVLLGEHDFSSFRAAACQAKTPVKTRHRIDMHFRPAGQAPMRDGQMDCGYWRFEFEGNAFLHHMIRNIMGCLLYVGQGAKPVEWMQQVLDARSREVAAPTFSPDGLYFLGPVYDARWGLPSDTPPFAWLP
ncbi:MAG: tRNA pseudouridine(38-40) synthase TruA [Acidovorax sp.]|jgi:tRNA pseudouridine38-40 synthase|nr:tRNA pseudouridine(38-40) synthase TruA [Acidovorax sp.]